MVGALADWFAVTALFRHPMGVPVPHTALIPRKKDQLGAALTEFVQENFLDSEVAHEKVDGLKVAEAAGGWLRREENAARTAREIATAARGAMAAADDDAVQELLRQLMERHMVAPDWSPTLAGVLEDVVAGRHHERVVDLVVAHTGDWVAAHPELFVETVRRRSPEWSPDLVDRLLAERLHAETLKYLAGIRRDRQHEARRAVDDWLDRLAGDLLARLGEVLRTLRGPLLDDRRPYGVSGLVLDLCRPAAERLQFGGHSLRRRHRSGDRPPRRSRSTIPVRVA